MESSAPSFSLQVGDYISYTRRYGSKQRNRLAYVYMADEKGVLAEDSITDEVYDLDFAALANWEKVSRDGSTTDSE